VAFTWEGRRRDGGRNDPYSYHVLGTNAFPDAAVLSPFTCAFEFDREPEKEVSHLKRALMKASVHVLSGAYDAGVLVYVRHRERAKTDYLGDGLNTDRLLMRVP
jgi:hypothetical protein